MIKFLFILLNLICLSNSFSQNLEEKFNSQELQDSNRKKRKKDQQELYDSLHRKIFNNGEKFTCGSIYNTFVFFNNTAYRLKTLNLRVDPDMEKRIYHFAKIENNLVTSLEELQNYRKNDNTIRFSDSYKLYEININSLQMFLQPINGNEISKVICKRI